MDTVVSQFYIKCMFHQDHKWTDKLLLALNINKKGQFKVRLPIVNV